MFPRTATHKEYKTTGRDRKKKDILEKYFKMGGRKGKNSEIILFERTKTTRL